MILENFFYNDIFLTDMDDLFCELNIDVIDEINEFDDDWSIDCEETTLEKMFVLNNDFICDSIIGRIGIFEDRFPEDSDNIFEKIRKAITESIDLDKLNNSIPSLYYPNGNKFKITKADLLKNF